MAKIKKGFRRWEDVQAQHFTPQEIEEDRLAAQQEVIEMTLREIREMVGKTQAEVAELAEVTQSELSKVEHRESHRLDSLRRYITALGGVLEITARFGDKSIRIRGV
jgi:predicted XRE-type DNA-binding protein